MTTSSGPKLLCDTKYFTFEGSNAARSRRPSPDLIIPNSTMFQMARLNTIPVLTMALLGFTNAEMQAQQTQRRPPPGVSADQALQMAQQDPALGQRLRQQLLQSGLSPEEIRARLRGSGY